MQKSKCYSVAVVADAGDIADAGAIDMREYDGALLFIPSGSSITSLTWYASYDGSTYSALNGSDNSAVTQTVAAAKAVHIHPACNVAALLKVVGDAAGTITVCTKRLG